MLQHVNVLRAAAALATLRVPGIRPACATSHSATTPALHRSNRVPHPTRAGPNHVPHLHGIHIVQQAYHRACEPVKPRRCRALGQLRSLQELLLFIRSSVQDTQYSPAAGMYRLYWPSLTYLKLRTDSSIVGGDALHVLARCTDIPTTCSVHFGYFWPDDTASPRPLAVKGWGAGWLHAAFNDHDVCRLPVTLVDDSDVATYINALGGLGCAQMGFQHSLRLGVAVTPAGLHRLASAPQLGIEGASTDALQPYMNT